MPTSIELYKQQRHRRFGTANPEKMDLSHWKWMVQNKHDPYAAMQHFNASLDENNGPDWCFSHRYGMSCTKLLDGRTIYIGGEYEDWYDPEFCIYNDVVVLSGEDNIEIFGYPRHEFPPTDYHTATLIENRIVIIGGLGYHDDRKPGYTPVFAVDTQTYKIKRLETTGENPGWIFKHVASPDPNGNTIVISDGEIYTGKSQDQQTEPNADSFELDLRSLRWRRLQLNPEQN